MDKKEENIKIYIVGIFINQQMPDKKISIY
jgi:hypothetical protein